GETDANKKDDCKGNPIIPATGNKLEPAFDFATNGEAPLSLSRTYNHRWSGYGLFGPHWLSNLDYVLGFGGALGGSCTPQPGGVVCALGTKKYIFAWRPDGRSVKYIKNTVDGIYYEDKPTPIAKIVVQGDGSFVMYGDDTNIETYLANGFLSTIKNSQGVGWTYTYNGTYLYRVTHTSGRYIEMTWTNGDLTAVRDPAGNSYGFTYGASHRLTTATKPGTPAITTTYHYEVANDIWALTGKSINGVRWSTFTYDASGNATSTQHSGKEKYSFSYAPGANGLVTVTQTNPLGKVSTLTYQNGVHQSETGQASTYCAATYAAMTYDANGYLQLSSDFNGNTTTYGYASNGQLNQRIDGFSKPEAKKTIFACDLTKNRLTSTTVGGSAAGTDYSRLAYTYTADNRLATATLTNLTSTGITNSQLTTTYTYVKFPNGMLSSMVVDGPLAGTGDAMTTTYDTSGNVTSVANSLGHAVTYSQYNAMGWPTRIIGVNSAVTDFTYDAQGRVLKIREYPNGVAADTQYAFNSQDLLASLTAADGAVTNYEYDDAHRMTRTWGMANGTVAGGADQEERIYAYNLNSQIISVSDRKLVGQYQRQCKTWAVIEPGSPPECIEEEQVWVLVPTTTRSKFVDYDELGRIRARRGNNGQNLRYNYDLNGNLTKITDSLNKVTTYAWDSLDRLIKVTDAKLGVTDLKYDFGSNVSWIRDPRSLITTYAYDGLGHLWSRSSPDTGLTSFTYNTSGQLTKKTSADNGMLDYTYADPLGRLTKISRGLEARNYTYDTCTLSKGLLCSMTSVSSAGATLSTSQMAYFSNGLLARRRDIDMGGDDLTSYFYDNMNRLTGLTYPSGVTVGYGYASGKLTTMTSNVAGANVTVASYINYEPYGGPNSWTYGNGFKRGYSYDLDGRVTGISTVAGSNVQQSLTAAYNNNNLLTAVTNAVNAGNSQTYQYDELSRLTHDAYPNNVTVIDDTFDAVGNRSQRTRVDNSVSAITNYTPSATSNRLQSSGGTVSRNFFYNNQGNLTSSTGWLGNRTYAYDAFERLNSITIDGTTAAYTYDAQDQRVGKIAGGLTSRYVYGAQNQLLAEMTPNGWKSYLYLFGQLIAVVNNSSNTLYFIHTDLQGRPEVATHWNQVPVWKATNGGYSRSVTLDSIGGINLGFPGQYYDSESGTWYNGFRDYDASIGRYLQSDPTGLSGGLNTFSYVGGNPVNSVDPFGLAADCSTYMDRYLNFVTDHAINVGPAAVALVGGVWPKSLAPAGGFRGPLLGSSNPLTSVPRGFGMPGGSSAIVRGGAAVIGLATVAIGMYDATIEVEGFVYAAMDAPPEGSGCDCEK
ncbi:MAG: RHS repeat-associated core domain-containing protein, partial [Luteimonas sp.]